MEKLKNYLHEIESLLIFNESGDENLEDGILILAEGSLELVKLVMEKSNIDLINHRKKGLEVLAESIIEILNYRVRQDILFKDVRENAVAL